MGCSLADKACGQVALLTLHCNNCTSCVHGWWVLQICFLAGADQPVMLQLAVHRLSWCSTLASVTQAYVRR